jgi:DNA polymerase I-like protein with 3'-5' exonuclease and polymerase domains
MQIHDSLVLEVNEGETIWKPFARWMREMMCETIKLAVPVTADFKMGKNWADTEKVKLD